MEKRKKKERHKKKKRAKFYSQKLKKKLHFHVTPRHPKQECNGICITHKLFVCSMVLVVSKLAHPARSVSIMGVHLSLAEGNNLWTGSWASRV
jgi:hypothetical protein